MSKDACVRRFAAGVPVFVVAACSAGSTLAEESPAELETVLVRARSGFSATGATLGTPVPEIELPLSLTRIAVDDLADRQPRNIADMAEFSAGVGRRSSYWGFDSPTFQLRGFNAGENSAYYRDGFRYPARGPQSMANVEAIEILRGPQSALYGWSDPGGVVQVLTRQPTDQALANASLQANSWGGAQTVLDLGGALGERAKFRWVTAYDDWQSFRNGVSGQQFFIAPTLDFDFDERRTLRLAFEWLDDRRHTDYGIPAYGGFPAKVPVEWNYGESWGRQHSQTGRVAAFWQQPALDGDLTMAFSYTELKYLQYRDAESAWVDGNTLNRWYESYPERYRWAMAYADWSRNFLIGAQNHRIATRLELSRETRSLYGGEWDDYTPIDIFNPVHGLAWAPTAEYTVYDQSWVNRNAGVVLQDEITMGNWIWLLGLRWSALNQRFDFSEYRPGNYQIHTTQQDHAVSPRLGLTWRASTMVSLYGNYAAGAMPSLPQARSYGDRPFSATDSQQLEAGIKVQAENGNWLTTLAAFDIRRNNVLTRDPEHPGYSIQTGEQRSRGVEWQWQGRIAPLWQATAQATWLNAEIVEDNRYAPGNRLPYAPHFGASAWLTRYVLLDGQPRLSFSGGFVHQGQRYADFSNAVALPAYTRFDLGAGYREKDWRLSLTLENVTDQRYYASGVENRPAVIYPGPPRTLMMRVSYDFR